MAMNLLSARRIETVAPAKKSYYLKDGGSLFLLVQPNGSKLWRYRYRIEKRGQIFSIGKYPEISLERARYERDQASKLVKQGIHPRLERKARIVAQVTSNEHTFKPVALRWMAANSWSAYYTKQIEDYLTKDVFPKIGDLPIKELGASHLRSVIQPVAARGATSVATLIRQWCSQIFAHAATEGICDYDPTSLLKGLVKRPPVRHNPPLTWDQLPVFLRQLDEWNGFRTTVLALRLMALTFVRTKELRYAEWSMVDYDNALWSIPQGSMKMRRPHLVPLSSQAIAALKELQTLTGGRAHLFPNTRRNSDVMSPTTLNNALKRMGYAGLFSSHGFRSTATTLLNLLGYPDKRIDLQLAHQKNKDSSRAPYDHAKFLSSRRIIMQDWADILDALHEGSALNQITEAFGPLSDRRTQLLRVIERE